MPTRRRVLPVLLALAAQVPGSRALAQQPGAGASWRPTVRLQSEVRYDNNPFLLDTVHKQKLEGPSAADSVNGRFRDMTRGTDVIPIPSLQLGLEGPGLGGRILGVSAGVAYETNLHNAARRHAELEFRIDQALRRAGGLRFTADWRPSYFHKNYLADAVDLDANGNISAAEKRYEAARSNELDLALRYRHRLLKSTDQRPVGITAELEAGYLGRSYDAPFAGRSRNGPDGRAGLAVQMGPAWTLGVDYGVASLGGDVDSAVLILDENEFGVDFNGNLTITDPSARAAVLLDYSRVERQLDVTLQGDVGAASVAVGYGLRKRRFSSTQPYDVVNRARRDRLHELTADVDLRLAAGLHMDFGVRRGAQTTDRAGDPGSVGEVADYSRFVASAGLRYRF
jgi:hypothetical protein